MLNDANINWHHLSALIYVYALDARLAKALLAAHNDWRWHEDEIKPQIQTSQPRRTHRRRSANLPRQADVQGHAHHGFPGSRASRFRNALGTHCLVLARQSPDGSHYRGCEIGQRSVQG